MQVTVEASSKLEIHTPGVVSYHFKDPNQRSTFQTQTLQILLSKSAALNSSLIILRRVTIPPSVAGVHLLFRHNHTQYEPTLPSATPGSHQLHWNQGALSDDQFLKAIPGLQKRATPEIFRDAGAPLIIRFFNALVKGRSSRPLW